MNPLFDATIYATEEAILNALVAAETMTGRDGRTIERAAGRPRPRAATRLAAAGLPPGLRRRRASGPAGTSFVRVVPAPDHVVHEVVVDVHEHEERREDTASPRAVSWPARLAMRAANARSRNVRAPWNRTQPRPAPTPPGRRAARPPDGRKRRALAARASFRCSSQTKYRYWIECSAGTRSASADRCRSRSSTARR